MRKEFKDRNISELGREKRVKRMKEKAFKSNK